MLSVRCPLCGSEQSRAIFRDFGYDKREYSLVKCDCGFRYLNPQPTDDELGRIYSTYYGDSSALEFTETALKFRSPVFKSVVSLLAPFKGQERTLLDIGCGNGEFLLHARREGWKVAGVEVAGPAVDFARRERGLSVLEGSFTELPFDDDSMEAVTILDVLEHLREPRKTLQSMYRVLKPGGVVVIRVPNTPFQIFKARLQRLRHGRQHTTLASPLHLNHFGPKDLSNAVREAGFKILRLEAGAADGVGRSLVVKSAYVGFSNVIAKATGIQVGNILSLVATKPI